MKHLTAFGFAALLAFALAASGCGGNTATAPTVNPPTVTEVFNGSLDSGGSNVHTFTLTKTGEIDATITGETVLVNGTATAVTIGLGLDLGVWDGTSCGAAFTNPAAKTGTVVSGVASTLTSFCVRLYDVGNITPGSPVSYTVSVAHP
jgi:hypothetical protein